MLRGWWKSGKHGRTVDSRWEWLRVGCRSRAAVVLFSSLLISAAIVRAGDDDEEEKSPLSAAQQKFAQKFAGVIAWEGRFTFECRGRQSGGETTRYNYEQVGLTSGTFRLEADRRNWFPKRGDFNWVGTGTADGTLQFHDAAWDRQGLGIETSLDVSGKFPMKNVSLTLWISRDYASLHAGHTEEKDYVETHERGHAVAEVNLSNGQYERRRKEIDIKGRFEPIKWGSLSKDGNNWDNIRSGPGVTVFNYEFDGGYSWGRAGTHSTSHVIMYPVYDDLDVEVEAPGYEQWRPLGSVDQPGKAGNCLAFRARLVRKQPDGKPLPAVKKFRFELVGTSTEPGVCLNWPVAAKDHDFDLKMVEGASFPLPGTFMGGAKVSSQGQKAEFKDPPSDEQGNPYADIAVESYDFGGRAELLAVCELDDGREIIGKLKGAGSGDHAVLIPKRKAGEWTAKSWRDTHGVGALSDNDDEEKVAGQPFNGDGFTLYEEYRGFVANRKHYEGDPKRKDFFVRNYIGPPAQAGIALFSSVSQIRVQHRLQDDEGNTKRVMNMNHAAAPHRVDQHFVVMMNAEGTGSSGGRTHPMSGVSLGRAWRPKDVLKITVEMPGRLDGTFAVGRGINRYNLRDIPARQAYARGVAHELLHSVGVDHHGEGETAQELYFQAASDPNNPTHHVRFSTHSPYFPDSELSLPANGIPNRLDRGDTITLLWEDTGGDVAEEMAGPFEEALAAERAYRAAHPELGNGSERAAKFPHYGKSVAYWQETSLYNGVVNGATGRGYEQWRQTGTWPEFMRFVTSGELGQADSGNELCLMRYYFANAYPVKGKSNTYYLVRNGQNRIGNLVCESPTGTGANEAAHEPQPRFGDAAEGRGKCLAAICPNDAIPPQ